MKTFQVSNPVIRIAADLLSFVQPLNIAINFKINSTELTSKLFEQFDLQKAEIQWQQTFALKEISEGQNKIEVSLIEQSQGLLVSFEGELIVTESAQVISSEWKDHQVTIQFELRQIEEQLEKGKSTSRALGKVDKHKGQQFKEDNTHHQNEIVHHQTRKKHFEERKKRQTEEQLKLAAIFTNQKQKAREIAKQLLRKLQIKAQKKIQAKKSDRALVDKKKQTTITSKLNSDRNKQNQLFHQRFQKLNYEEDELFCRSPSPKESVPHSQSPARSLLKEQIRVFRSKFGDKIYDNQNSTTMQKSILCFSVPKGPRFKHLKYNGVQPSYYVGTCFASKNKGTSFGYGTRKPYPQWMVRNMHENPAPNVYTVNQPPLEHSSSSKGFSFGISYKYYEKASIVGTECSKKNTAKAGIFPKLSKPTTSNTLRVAALDTSKGHYHYRT